MTEANLWNWLRKNKLGKDLHMHRIENVVGSGTPDVEGCYRGNQFWLELKVSKKPVRETTPIHIRYRPMQEAWHRRCCRAGGRCFVLVQVGRGRYLLPSMEAFGPPAPLENLERLALVPPGSSASEIIIGASRWMLDKATT